MKKLLLLLLILPFAGIAQNTLPIYLKLGPQAFVPKGDPLTVGGNLAFGVRAGRFITVGPTVSYFKLNGMKKGIVPVGLDVNVSDFGVKKVCPVFTGQLLYPVHNDGENIVGPGGSEYKTKGVFMAHAGAGLAFPFNNRQKLIVTAGYSRLTMKVQNENEGQNLFVLSVAAIL